MTVTTSRIGSLDFVDIKASIRNYLSAQTEFTDYDFEGSGISQLINILAYNAHYDSLSANFMLNEMFLDTAVKRGTIVSKAKELGYTPRSRGAAKSTITLTFSNVTNAANIYSLILPQGSRFLTSVGSDHFTFTTMAAKTLPRTVENGNYIYRCVVDAYEGILTQQLEKYTVIDPTILIPNKDIDTATLSVSVNESGTWVDYSSPQSFLSASASSNVFMFQEGFGGYEVYFGDDVIGHKPIENSSIKMLYMVTSGDAANGATNFSLQSAVSGTTGATITISATKAANGRSAETDESIKSNAILQYGTQNRAVIARDYASLTLQNFNEVVDCLSWDGSENSPPRFGKVILCARPAIGDILTSNQKATIRSFLQTKGVANTGIDFIDPEYIDIIIRTSIRYNLNLLNIGTYELEFLVKQAINNFTAVEVGKFGGKLRYSNLVKAIDNSNYSIINSSTSIKLLKRMTPVLFNNNAFRFEFSNELKPGSLVSTIFFVNGTDRLFIQDNNGSLNIVYDKNGVATLLLANIGTIDYVTGVVQIDTLRPSSIEGFTIDFSAVPINQDILSTKNIILNVSSENVLVDVLPDYT